MSHEQQITQALDALVEEGYLPGYAFAVRSGDELVQGAGGVVDLESGEPVRPDTPFWIASLSKLVGAVVTMREVDAGTFALGDPITRWLPELAPAALADGRQPATPITVRHLLTMTSGWGVTYGPGDSQAAELAEREIAPGPGCPRVDAGTFLERLAEVPLAAEPGTAWRYHTSAELLSILLERATGRGNEESVRAGLVEPLGLGTLTFDHTVPAATTYDSDGRTPAPTITPARSFASFGSGLIATAADYARVLADVAADAPRSLSAASARAIRSVQLEPEVRRTAGRIIDPWASYGFQVAVNTEDTARRGRSGRFGWSGGTGCVAGGDPAAGLSAAFLGTRRMGSPFGQREFDAFWDAVYA